MKRLVDHGFASVFGDPAVMAFVREAMEVSEPYEAFCARPLPAGLSREMAWDVVSFSRRLQGWPSTMGGDPNDPFTSFWVVPRSMVPNLVATMQKTADRSHLWTEVRRYERQPVVTRFLVEDLHAACQRDAIDVEYERLRAMVVHGEEPRTPEERAVRNAVGLVWSLPGSALDTGSLDALIDSVIVPSLGRGLDGLPGRSRLLSPPAIDPQVQAEPRSAARRGLADILDCPESWGDFTFLGQIMASESFFERLPFERCNALIELVVRHVGFARLGVPPESWGDFTFLGQIMASESFFERLPFERCNALIELVVRHVGFARLGVPALGYAPLSKIRLDWELGLMPPDEVLAPHGKAIVQTPFGTDCTWALCQYVVFFDRWLLRMERDLEREREGRERRKEELDADQRLNLRQRELLKFLAENPSEAFDVRAYEDRFGVAMSTANTDLAKLASLGYLDGRYEGRRQVYRLR